MITCQSLYRRKVKSHKLVNLAKELGIKISAKTILSALRWSEVAITGSRGARGQYHKWRGSGKNLLRDGERFYWECISAQKAYYAGKNKFLSVTLQEVALAFAAWFNFYFAGQNFDMEAVLVGTKPP